MMCYLFAKHLLLLLTSHFWMRIERSTFVYHYHKNPVEIDVQMNPLKTETNYHSFENSKLEFLFVLLIK